MDVTLILNAEEQKAFVQLIDAALRHAGTGALDAAAHFKGRLLKAAGTAQLAAASTHAPDRALAGGA